MLNMLFYEYAYRIAFALFAVFICDVVAGKISLWWFERQLPLSLGNVPEFLLLFTACVFFVAGILRSESIENKSLDVNP